MNIVEINTCDYGSTGKIMLQTAEAARKAGHNVFTFSRKWIHQPAPAKGHSYFGYFLENALHRTLAQITGLTECFSYFGTKKLIKEFNKIKPDVIHLHNLHGNYINLPLLFEYLKKSNAKIVWTLHDCWNFTGHCPHFDMIGCDKWKTCCGDCPEYKEYPKSAFDNSKFMYLLKKKWFTGMDNLTIVTPSDWLAGLVKQSFLKDYPVKVINNGIDLSVFKPTESDFRQKCACEDKNIILGVAFGWGKRKGLDVFTELSKRLDNRFQIVLVGTDSEVDKQLPDRIISIHRTQSQAELAEIYTAADLFVNPTREDNYPTVNIEALACGIPILTFDTGGSPEIPDGTCGSVVPKDDIDAMWNEIISICETQPFSRSNCLKRAKQFDMGKKFKAYIDLYNSINY